MPYGTILTDVIQSSTAGTPPQFNDGNSVQIGTLCRAWVYFTGSTGAVGRSFNVSSVTRNSAGNWTVNITNSLSATPVAVCAADAGSNVIGPYATPSATTVGIQTKNTGGSNIDTGTIYCACFT